MKHLTCFFPLFRLWSSKYPTEKRSHLSRGLLGPHAGIITPKEDELVKLALNLRRHYLKVSSITGSSLLSSGSSLEGLLENCLSEKTGTKLTSGCVVGWFENPLKSGPVRFLSSLPHLLIDC